MGRDESNSHLQDDSEEINLGRRIRQSDTERQPWNSYGEMDVLLLFDSYLKRTPRSDLIHMSEALRLVGCTVRVRTSGWLSIRVLPKGGPVPAT